MWCHWDVTFFIHVFSLRSALDLMCDVINACPVMPLRCALYLMCDVINRTRSSFMFSLSYDLYVVCDVIRMSCALHLTCDVTVMCLWSYLWCHRDIPINISFDVTEMRLWSYIRYHQDVANEGQCDVIEMCHLGHTGSNLGYKLGQIVGELGQSTCAFYEMCS